MKVVYLGPTEFHTLEHGRVYEVLSEEDGWYRIIDKSGEDYLYPKDDFIILEELEWKDRFMNNKVYDRLKYFFRYAFGTIWKTIQRFFRKCYIF